VHLNLAFAFFSVIKVMVSLGVLAFSETECEKPLNKWVIFMLMHDSLYSLCQFLLVKQILSTNYAAEGGNEEALAGGNQGEGNEFTIFTLSERAERKNKCISALAEICRIYYIVLFIYGQILYYQEGTNCAVVAPTVNTLVLVYICFAYFYIGIPIILLILACLCMPVLIFIAIMVSRRAQVPANNDAINRLQVIKYHRESLPGTPECSICITDYVENDDIIQLKCSPMHHFHSECLKRRLIINGLCPICRTRIDMETNANPNNTASVEMRTN